MIDIPTNPQQLIRPLLYQQVIDNLSNTRTSVIITGLKMDKPDHYYVKKPLKLSCLTSTISKIMKETRSPEISAPGKNRSHRIGSDLI